MPEQREPNAGEATVVVDDLATLRAMSDPLRMRMIELMSRGEWTVKRVAAALGVRPTRLYRHVAILESHGLLRVTGTRLVSGITEKRYTAPTRLTVEPRLLGASGGPGDVAHGVDGLIATAFAAVRREVGAAIRAREAAGPSDGSARESITLTFDEARLRRADAQEFGRRLQALAAEFEAERFDAPASPTGVDADAAARGSTGADDASESGDTARYRLLIGFYRTADE